MLDELAYDAQSGVIPDSLLKRKEKEAKGKSDKIGKLDSTGIIRLDITISYKELELFEPPLGDGGYGIVYRGRWKEQDVAVKKLKVQTISQAALKELRKEAEIMFQMGLESPYIVPVKKICLEVPHYSLVMELMPKGSLWQLLKPGQDLPWPVRYQIALDVSYGLRDLHARSILHRDLKSLNILLDDRLRAKLTDFGLSKIKQETASQSTHVKGTPQWMAPELFDDEPKMTEQSDIYSLGMVLWELASRQMPFATALNQQVVIGWLMRGKKEQIPTDCPKELKSLIESCWEIPAKRPTAVQVGEKLKSLLAMDKEKKTEPTKAAVLDSMESLARFQSLSATQTPPDDASKKLKQMEEKMANMQLEHKKQLQMQKQAMEEAQRKKQQKDSQLSSSSQIPKFPASASSSMLSISPSLSLTLIPPPKAKISPEQLKLQDDLILACEQGDDKEVKNCLSRGAKPDIPNVGGKHPLGAAVWGMNPAVVNILLNQLGGVSPMTWEECETHNRKYYYPRQTFLTDNCQFPDTYGSWHQFLIMIEPSPFIRSGYLERANQKWRAQHTESWSALVAWVSDRLPKQRYMDVLGIIDFCAIMNDTIGGWKNYKTQIQQKIESAQQLKAGKTMT